MKKVFKYILILFVLLFLCKGWVYRKVVAYTSTGERNNYLIEKLELKLLVDKEIREGLNVEGILQEVNKLVANVLSFSSNQKSYNPNVFYKAKKAHCVGYAQLYTTICNYVLKKNGLSNSWKANIHVGKISLLGMDIHSYSSSSFFKDHDFVIITNIKTQERIAIDPSLYDYLRIEKVTLKE